MQDEGDGRSSRRWQELRDQALNKAEERRGQRGVVSDTKLQTDLTVGGGAALEDFKLLPGRGSNSEQINILERQAGANLRV